MRPVRIIIMAKAPKPGFAKTRLIPALGIAGAAVLAERMLNRTLAAALDADCGPVELCAAPAIGEEAWGSMRFPDNVEFSAQSTGNLGQRMANAVGPRLERGERVLLTGTDCAEISALLLWDAAAGLEDHDAVIHPTADGGYALLGLRRFDPSLFDNIAWSTDTVARETLVRLERLDWRVQVGRTLHDIDEPSDLVHWTGTSA